MNWDQIEGKWKQMMGAVRERWGKLTNDDLDVIAGKREAFIGRVQERYGFTKEQAQKEIDEWAKKLDARRYEREKRAA
ncbi:MAG TPA: CsbD family protein [Acidobacteriota bacterium]|jgi:uncharacterized protein YjbJ (UPF0337 family)|nr:CsbD family protein [Candidatus Acidoferrales bacterium]